MKIEADKKSVLSPMPRVIVTVRDKNGFDNALVVGYCGNCSFAPPMVMVGIVPSRYSYHMIKENGCFVVHLVNNNQSELYKCCGSESAKDGDKLKKHGIKLHNANIVNAAIIDECPVAIECTVVDSIMTGSHEMFIGKVEYVHADSENVGKDGKIDFSKLDIMRGN